MKEDLHGQLCSLFQNVHNRASEGYESYFDPRKIRFHAYLGVGTLVWMMTVLLTDSITDVERGLLFATIIFSFHEYIEERTKHLIEVITVVLDSDIKPPLGLVAGISAIVNLVIATPMFAHSDYTHLFGVYVLYLSMYWIFSRKLIRTRMRSDDPVWRRLTVWTITVLGPVFSAYVFSKYTWDNAEEIVTLISSYTQTQLHPVEAALVILFIIGLVILLLGLLSIHSVVTRWGTTLLVGYMGIIVSAPVLPFYIGVDEASNLFDWWASISILIVYVIIGVPLVFSWMGWVENQDNET